MFGSQIMQHFFLFQGCTVLWVYVFFLNYYRYFSLLKKLLLIQIFRSVNTVAIAPFHS